MNKYAAAAALLLSGCITTEQPVVKGVDMNVIYPTVNERVVDNKYPVIVISHGAGGLGKNYFKWASYFRSLGFATLVIDHHTARGYNDKTIHTVSNTHLTLPTNRELKITEVAIS